MSIALEAKVRELEARVKALEEALRELSMIAPEAPMADDDPRRVAYHETLIDAYEKKFGHPPHHRMKLATIKAALG